MYKRREKPAGYNLLLSLESHTPFTALSSFLPSRVQVEEMNQGTQT